MTEDDARKTNQTNQQIVARLGETNATLVAIQETLLALTEIMASFGAMAEALAVTVAEKHGLDLRPAVAAYQERFSGDEAPEAPEAEPSKPLTPVQQALRDTLGPKLYEQQVKDGIIHG